MSNQPPPHFVPTLNQAVPTQEAAATTIMANADSVQGSEKTSFSHSMVDFDLGDFDAVHAAKVQIESTLQRYQSASYGHATQPTAVSPQQQAQAQQAQTQAQMAAAAAAQQPVTREERQQQARMAALQARQQQIQLMQQQYAQQQAAQAAMARTAGAAGNMLRLPPEWQEQLQNMISNSVRQQLQQQMPFLLLQWTRQIEEQIVMQVQTEALQLLKKWQES